MAIRIVGIIAADITVRQKHILAKSHEYVASGGYAGCKFFKAATSFGRNNYYTWDAIN